MPKSESEVQNIRRKSSRAKKMVNHSLLNDLPEDVVNSVMKGADKEMKMPPGYNPSDDSEDDYKPGPKKGRRKDDSDIDSEEESRAKKPRRTPGRKPKYSSPQISTPRPNTIPSATPRPSPIITTTPRPTSTNTPTSAPRIKPEPGQEETEACLLCEKTVSVHRDARFHYSVHFYEENAFLTLLKPEDLLNGKAQDENGRVYKYTCPHDGCTKRKMGYKEMCVHLATAHQQLRQLMKADKRPGMKEVLNRLYPEEPTFSTVKVKQEKGVTATPHTVTTLRQELDNSEDVDDPSEPDTTSRPSTARKYNKAAPASRRPAVQVKQQPVKTKTEVKSEGTSLAPRVDKIHNCLVCNGPGRTSKDGRNLNLGSGLQELKYHYSVCVYNEGGLMQFVDPGQGEDVKYEDLELYGNKYRYKCPFVNCTKNQGRNKAIGYKEYAIHCGVAHHQIERWMELEEDKRTGLKEVYTAIKTARERDGLELEDMPEVVVEEMHTCLICRGEDKEGKNLSFDGSKIYQTRYHYAACYYEEGAYKAKFPPGPQNTKEDGEPKDILGKEVKYSCQEKGCTVKRKMGYKEFTIHMSNEHGGLEEVMRADHREEVRALADHIKK